ncbi:DUF2975 domain-containing protein [Paenibacillus agaridevorans]|uniref:DUF2975 domain-containing protein n=1 Tax=Paenibacillus agaridevorans TaxID=171404 RepID=UPI001BE42270|nr:DUF2975 domain-containing protein [Paenibacillus agaridevorans]
MGIPILALCAFGLPTIASDPAERYPEYWLYAIIAGIYAAAIPYFIALFQTMKLLAYIDKNLAFSELSVTALRNIRNCAIAVSALFAACLPFLYLIADVDDAPGMIVVGMVFVFAPLVIAVFAAVLQKLLNNAIAIQAENDLTI